MKYANIGGQAVMEGIMMRCGEDYSIAVRKSDGEIELKKDVYKSLTARCHMQKVPVIRGVLSFVDSLYLGMSSLTYSAEFFEEETPEEEDADKAKSGKDAKKESVGEKMLMGGTVMVSIILAIGIFMVLPFLVSNVLNRWIASSVIVNIIEGVLRVVIFLIYLVLISRIKDIQRTYMYHGAEHKTINCIEHGKELTPANAMAESRFHKRCGTSFLFIVVILCVIVHVVFFALVPVEGRLAKLLIRLALIPIIAGLSYELLQWTGRHESKLVDLLSQPGFWMQKLTTSEPDESMIEVAIAAIEAIYDWKKFQEELEDDQKEPQH